jgi:bifunctional isochorismate lyase/aryl carrier protein
MHSNMKKENYNTDIKKVSNSILKHIKKFTGREKKEYNFKETALLVLDMQNFFLDEKSHAFVPSAEAIIDNIKYISRFFHDNDGLVLYSRHFNDYSYDSMMHKWWRDSINKDLPDFDIIDSLMPTKHMIINKTEYDAFFKTRLNFYLKRYNIKNLIITGVLTNLCVDTTARSAFMKGYEVTVLADATATYNLEFQKASLLTLSHGIAYIDLTSNTLKKILNHEKE